MSLGVDGLTNYVPQKFGFISIGENLCTNILTIFKVNLILTGIKF